MWFLFYVLLPLALLVGFVFAFARYRYLRLRGAAQAELNRVYAAHAEQPRLEVTYSYGYPAFAVVFRNNALLQSAKDAGFNAAFTRAIAALCEGHGPKSRPFDAELAVGFRHENFLTRADIGIQ